ncbi:hypothetical protein GCM10010912_50160 [Paenibacillus albidus]|uniref:Uncharacterized protein n=1 Tax=Paenibacillus albidus TaxID=2041023 RepID=A0A917CWQ6_9BACL|nr:hypothetical protein [Paenibacillus albidus]GGF99352.1 hypothetical protein GCM10010912_50160 [Paenibacillus albidus]
MLIFFLVIAAVCVVIDLPLLRRRRRRRELLVWFMFWAAGMGAVVCSLYKINVPSPLLLVMLIYKPVNSLFEAWF